MIDAQDAAVTAILADGFDEQAIAGFPVVAGVGWREGPVLTFGREVVRGRADAAAGDEERAMRPEVGAKAIGGEREIVVQAERQAGAHRGFLRGGKLQIDLPLQILPEQNAAPMFAA